MINKLIGWIKQRLGIAAMESELAELRHVVEWHRQHAAVDADVQYRGRCTVVLTGVYKGSPYVHFYDVPGEYFSYLVEQFKEMKRYGSVRNIDAPRGIGR